jgi:2',3'-cyclic-nucleotide 2'-phosphodiesterase (5'-nucleotidase family)
MSFVSLTIPARGGLGRVLLLAALLAPAVVQAGPLRLQILHASDLEGGVDAIDDAPGFAAVVDALEGDAARKGVPSILLSAGDNYLLGPFFAAAADRSLRDRLRSVLGNSEAREGVGRVDLSIMNALGFDASALGNHEFDPGTGVMASIIAADIRDRDRDGNLDQPRWLGARFPYLSANLDFAADRTLSRLYTPEILDGSAFRPDTGDLSAVAAAPRLARAVLLRRGGETVAVVGATTPLLASISSPGATQVRGPGAGSNDMRALASVLQPAIDDAMRGGVDKVVLVSHLQQVALEQELAGLLRGVDVIVAGGSDTLLADPTDGLRRGDVVAGSYPIAVRNRDGDPALIVSTDGQYSYVGRLVVSFDAAGVVDPASVDAGESGAYATDEQGVARLWGTAGQAYAAGSKGARVRALASTVRDIVMVKDRRILGATSVFLEGRRKAVRSEETNLGNLVADAMLASARGVDDATVMAFKNGGGYRAEIGAIDGYSGALLPPQANPEAGKLAGQISQLDIENTLRFNNGLTLLTLTAAQVQQVLEHAVAASSPGATPGQFAQIAGLAFSFDPARAPGSRVRTAALKDASGETAEVLVRDGAVVGDASRRFRIVTLSFLADGGDGYPYPAFAEAGAVNRVDLEQGVMGDSGFARFGTEQDALASYLAGRFASQPFSAAETPPAQDARIQDLSLRMDSVAAR